jgi:hypothetical protein
MFNVQIKFIIFSIDIKDDKLTYYVLSSDKEKFQYPSIDLSTKMPILETKKICFENYVSLKLEWIEHRLLDIVQKTDIISIYYVCTIPIESKVINGIFLPVNQVLSDEVLQKAARTV